MRNYYFLLNYLKSYWMVITGALLTTAIVNLSTLIQPYLLKYIVNDVLNKKDFYALNLVILALLGSVILKGLSSYFQRYLMSLAGQSIIRDIRNRIFSHIQLLPLNFYENRKTGDLMSRLTSDVIVVQAVITASFVNLANDFAVFLGSFAWMIYRDWRLTLLTFVLAPLIGMATNKFARRIEKVTQLLQNNLSELTSIMQEIISGVRMVKAFCREGYEFDRFKEANQKNLYFNLKTEQLAASQTPVIEFFTTLGIAFVIWYGAIEVINHQMSVGDVFVFWGYLALSSTPLVRLTTTYSDIKRGMVSAERLSELLDVKVEEPDVNKPDLPVIKGQVEFNDVHFNYNDSEDVLKGVSFSAEPGEVIALVGPSGAGKSTFINLIPRFYEISSGKILIDNYDIKNFNIYSLRKQIGIVPQEPVLFNGTIYDNIAYGRLDASKEEIEEAANMANARDFITSFSEGFNTVIGERGVKLSGGQRQRIAIARVILRNPRILILDEATSSLDSESENLIQEALAKLMKDRTTFVIAHRLSTIYNANKILVIDGGEIKEVGNHEELIKQNGIYARLCSMQFQAAGFLK